MVVLNRKSLKLPRVEKEKFVLLLKLGLEYNGEQGLFSIKSYNNIEKLVDEVSNILGVERATFLQSCLICGRDFPCQECKYYEVCGTKNLPFYCVCSQCLKERKHM